MTTATTRTITKFGLDWNPVTSRYEFRCDLSERAHDWVIEHSLHRSMTSRSEGRNASNRHQDRTPSTQFNHDGMNVSGWATIYEFEQIPFEKWVPPMNMKPEDRACLGVYFIRTISVDGATGLRVGDEEGFVPDHWKYTQIAASHDYWTTFMRGYLLASDVRAKIAAHLKDPLFTPGYRRYEPGPCWYIHQGLLLPMPMPPHKLPGLE